MKDLIIGLMLGILVFGLGYTARIAVEYNDLARKYQTYREVFNGTLDYDLWVRIYTYNRNSLGDK